MRLDLRCTTKGTKPGQQKHCGAGCGHLARGLADREAEDVAATLVEIVRLGRVSAGRSPDLVRRKNPTQHRGRHAIARVSGLAGQVEAADRTLVTEISARIGCRRQAVDRAREEP